MAPGLGRRSRVAACLLAVAALAACTGTPEPEPPAPDDSVTASPAPSVSAVPGPTADGDRRLRLTTVARVPLPELLSVNGLELSGGRAVLSGCARCGPDGPDEAGALHEIDLATGRMRRVGVSAFEAGAVLPAGLDGDRLVWLDIEPVTAQFNGRTRWRLQLLDLRSGRSRTLAAASGATRRFPPGAVVGGGHVAWQEWSGEALAGPVRVADLRTGAARLVRDVPGPLGGVSDTAVFYVGPDAPDGQPVDIGNLETPADAFTLPLRGGPPEALSATRDVGSVTTDGRTAVWTASRGRPTTIWAARVEGGSPRVVYRGSTTERAVLRDAVAVLTSVDPVVEVAPLEGGPTVTVPDVPLADAGLAADGTRLAWIAAPGRDVQVDRRRPLELVVVEVR